MSKNELFQLRMSKAFKNKVRKTAKERDMTITEYVRIAINEQLKRDGK